MAKIKTGVVISRAMAKTAVVEVSSVSQHPLYLKAVRRTKNFHVHDEIGSKVGDKVEFKEIRPISRTKKWAIVKVIEAGGKSKRDRPAASVKDIKPSQESKSKTMEKPKKTVAPKAATAGKTIKKGKV
ncbi:MAG: 30S ribosomal protein S17 [Microgenomates group bacterium GW2011_GWA1_Microgenomates_45_10]|nr:MAG: 30S ribosomal protein S17 [Microgenomates group bacterium GW2011_GWA2_44_7]KKT78077.1 MAG: 30S ribosomal protein S17 [Microgenomates group bacterium GW2011_GWB1_44_8]KKT87414.1 MAG: 30S ribosomal protein S17 [Microgenomates group bacterium GW2011_GWA1_Microgenomates_45_10]